MKSPVLQDLAAALDQKARCAWLKLNRMTGVLFCLCLLSGICTPSLHAQSDSANNGVTVKDGKICKIQGDQLAELNEVLKLPFDVEVNTNGNFTVAGGKERKLGEGQIIRSDGWLVSPDGSVQPVFDHVIMQAGHVMVVRDGQAVTLAAAMTFPGGMTVQPDGTCGNAKSGQARLRDGQVFKMDGSAIMTKDAVTLINGRVVLQRDGTILTLNPVQVTGMNDATRVYGDGRIQPRGGEVRQMREGQTILFDGIPPN